MLEENAALIERLLGKRLDVITEERQYTDSFLGKTAERTFILKHH